MYLKELLTHLLKEDTLDEEERADAQPTFQAKPSPQDSRNTHDSDKVASDAVQTGGTTDEDDVDLEHDDQEYDDTLHIDSVDLDTQSSTSPRGLCSIPSRIWSSIFPSPSDEEEIHAYIPHYRILPIVSGIAIPFCILLEIPGLTEHWYIRTEGSTIIASKPNPPLLNLGMALSIFCAVSANICLVIRFLERRIKTMTILCTLFLSIHGKLASTFPLRVSATVFRYYQRCCSCYIRRNKGWLHIWAGILDDFMFHHRVHVHERDPHH